MGRSRKAMFQTIKDRVWAKLQGWKEKLLSKAGREVLIKVVTQAIPTYAMGVFKLLLCLCEDLNRMVSNFWWGQQSDASKIHWIAWQKLCQPKSKGGLGFRDLRAFNLAMLAKQGWKLEKEEDSLCFKIMKAKYFQSYKYFVARLGRNPFVYLEKNIFLIFLCLVKFKK
ncbi:hypothetical protein CFOL_v3_22399 [Cephalotus follicularis]|uniref:Zf-RVT domain-containing protein n=1 Tax=Cephalotus follicularis TaxID=3775 RepID=A0A1Q3CFB8_CEPFO|nr:hypothetical protein CFOL_v3_22399 [Cephalotus follicularis]